MNRSSGSTPAQSLRRHESSSLHKPPSAAATDPLLVSQAQRPSALKSPLTNNDRQLPYSVRRASTSSEPSLIDKDAVAVAAGHDGAAQLGPSSPSREAAVGKPLDDKSRILSPSKPVSKTQDSPVSSSATQLDSSPPYKSPTSTPSSIKTNKTSTTQNKTPTKSATGGIRSVTSDGHNRVQKLHISVPASAMTDSTNDVESHSTQNAVPQRKSSGQSGIEEASASSITHTKGDAMRQAMEARPRPERSVSRGRTHVDKSIEATVKKPETSGHVRSRKASHMLGIFDSQNESKRSAVRGHEAEHPGSDVSSSASRPISPDSPSSSIFQDIVRQDPNHFDYFGKNRVPSDATGVEDIYQSEEPGEISPKAPASPVIAPIDSTQEQTPRPRLPANLLQEIRETTVSRPPPLRTKASTPGVPTINERTGSDILQQVNDPHDEEEEHIAAAIYYPHEGPSAEEIESFEVHDDHTGNIRLEADFVPLKPKSNIVSQDVKDLPTPQEEHIDISVESHYEKSVFHGTLKKDEKADDDDTARTPRMPAVDKIKTFKPPVSSSESDIESSDELTDLSRPEDGITTPTARSPKQNRMRTGTVAKPKNAVTLAPYKHQVGGHSTIFRFSRRAVCKQLNNRENEFYERIEKTHPDMLKFLPRYIGVLNVTFSKGPKQEVVGVDDTDPQSQAEQAKELPLTEADLSVAADGQSSNQTHEITSGAHPRIVSHSQQFGPIPQVLLNQNRHILPSEYFGLPERPKSADPTHFRQRSRDLENGRSILSSELSKEKEHTSPARPPPPEHSPSWGTTSVNVPLKDKVLREVFGPPPIIHKKRHGHAHNTIPLRKDSENRRRGNMSLQVYDQGTTRRAPRRSHSVHQGDNISNDSVNNETDNDTSVLSKEYSSSTSRYDDLKQDLEHVKTTGSASTDASDSGSRSAVRRRHSGMGLRRRRKSLSGDDQPNLEYFEDEALSAMKEAEVFAMDEDDKQSNTTTGDQPNLTEPLSATIDQEADLEYTKLLVASGNDGAGAELHEIITADALPVNPKDAQSSNPDQRVAYFILLEDLTAGMGRPCVLDLKMGTRQYGVEANQKKIKSQRDKCRSTTSQELGVRICGMQTFNRKNKQSKYEDKYFGRNVKAGREFREALLRFLYDGVSTQSVEHHIPTIIHKISKLESMVRRLPGYRFYASSLLMYYDAEPEKSRDFQEAQKHGIDIVKQKQEEGKKWPPPIELKLVDFANCVTAEDPLLKNATAPPAHPHDVDRGYLRGLRTLKFSFERILDDLYKGRYFEYNEGEQIGRLKEKWTSEPGENAGVTPDADEGEVSI